MWPSISRPTILTKAATAPKSVPQSQGPPDPCEQALTPPGNANGLHKRCDAVGIGGGTAKGDFNGDGFADLAIGVPYEDQNGVNAVGGVNIIYGSSQDFPRPRDQFLDEVDFGFSYGSNDHFGWALASGDFNGDTFSDLAIGMPDWDATRDSNTGVVFVVNGSAAGLNTSTGHFLDVPGSTGRQGEPLSGPTSTATGLATSRSEARMRPSMEKAFSARPWLPISPRPARWRSFMVLQPGSCRGSEHRYFTRAGAESRPLAGTSLSEIRSSQATGWSSLARRGTALLGSCHRRPVRGPRTFRQTGRRPCPPD